jgi:hypothetical protein
LFPCLLELAGCDKSHGWFPFGGLDLHLFLVAFHTTALVLIITTVLIMVLILLGSGFACDYTLLVPHGMSARVCCLHASHRAMALPPYCSMSLLLLPSMSWPS